MYDNTAFATFLTSVSVTIKTVASIFYQEQTEQRTEGADLHQFLSFQFHFHRDKNKEESHTQYQLLFNKGWILVKT